MIFIITSSFPHLKLSNNYICSRCSRPKFIILGRYKIEVSKMINSQIWRGVLKLSQLRSIQTWLIWWSQRQYRSRYMGTCSKSIRRDPVFTDPPKLGYLLQNYLKLNHLHLLLCHLQLFFLQQVTCINIGHLQQKRILAAKQLAATTCSKHLQRNRQLVAKPFAKK